MIYFIFFFSCDLTIFFQVSWVRHDDVSLISVGKLKYIKDDRFKIIHEDNNIEWVLAIQSLKKSDEGLYECQVNASPMLRVTIYLNVVGM